jgi:hypothetical protein
MVAMRSGWSGGNGFTPGDGSLGLAAKQETRYTEAL